MVHVNPHLLSVDLDEAMDNELLSLSRTTRKQGSKYGNIQSPFLWIERHTHVGCWTELPWLVGPPFHHVFLQPEHL